MPSLSIQYINSRLYHHSLSSKPWDFSGMKRFCLHGISFLAHSQMSIWTTASSDVLVVVNERRFLPQILIYYFLADIAYQGLIFTEGTIAPKPMIVDISGMLEWLSAATLHQPTRLRKPQLHDVRINGVSRGIEKKCRSLKYNHIIHVGHNISHEIFVGYIMFLLCL